MTSPSQGNPLTQAAIGQLIKGQEAAARLEVLLQETTLGNSAIEAFKEVWDSFSRSISLLDSGKPLETGQDPAITGVSKKRKTSPGEVKRGASRRRSQPTSLRMVLSKTLDDGYTWRKYGQKEIQSSKFPRAYFRCTHKFDQGCNAIRQVQRSEVDESMFIITYMGDHTCRDPSMLPQIISPPSLKGSCLISFGSSPTDNRQEAPLPSSSPSYVPERHEDVLSNLSPGTSSSEYVARAAAYNEGSKLMTPLGSTSDHGDVDSGFHSSTSSLDMDFVTDSFEDIFSFDHDGFL
ncbi:transcription factor WRKY45-1 [Elaeis guineensis]|uniref:Probable WRKY transcription factor 70 n=1 Tax=Elaeis guineensis var. tenera TaxID=51953 RepID=A0A6J0PHV2_ELAGV|nr:probable WRKY transcription factor 70 [Elaeis guineensis]